MSFHAQPVPLIQLTDTNKIINSSTATFMTRSLKKTTSPELQISPEQATNPAKSLRETSREMTYSDRGLPRRETNKKLIARYK